MNRFSGTFKDWQLHLWGEAIDGETQSLHPLPTAEVTTEEWLDVGARPASYLSLSTPPGEISPTTSIIFSSVGWQNNKVTSLWPWLCVFLILSVFSLVMVSKRFCSGPRRLGTNGAVLQDDSNDAEMEGQEGA